MPTEPNLLGAAEAARRIARRELTSEALVAACLARIARREDTVQAWAHVAAEQALAQARALDREAPRSPLHGIPVGIKDVIDTADQPTEYGSPIHAGHVPRTDAACVALLRRAGCVILGKAATAEFAGNHPAKTRNPRDPRHTPGGSSSGSAAAVADGMVPLTLGTQTGGSILRPASYCGVVGFKPTLNAIPRPGLKFVAESLDTIGLLAREVEDVAAALHVLSGRALADLHAAAGRAPRIGLFRTPRWHEADAAAQHAIEATASACAAAGARVVECAAPAGFDALYELQVTLMNYESARAFAWEHAHHATALSASLRERIEAGWSTSRDEYDRVRRLARDCRRQLDAQLRDLDFLITPVTTGEAPATLASTGTSVFLRVWTLMSVPTVSLPAGTGPSGLPLGVQLVGRYDQDEALLAWAHWVAGRTPAAR